MEVDQHYITEKQTSINWLFHVHMDGRFKPGDGGEETRGGGSEESVLKGVNESLSNDDKGLKEFSETSKVTSGDKTFESGIVTFGN